MAQILIIEDDKKISRVLERIITGLGHKVKMAGTLAEATHVSSVNDFDVILLDLSLPDGNGLSILPDLGSAASEPEIIIVTGTGDQSGAEVAFKSGAWDFVPKPFLPEDVALPIARALQYRQEKIISRQPKLLYRETIIGDSPEINACLELVARASAANADVLITGETGTGKELFAQAIHRNSARASQPFIIVDCASHPEQLMESALFGHEKGAFTGAEKSRTGLIRQAHQGTLFLDEVGELTLPMQKIFLRVLQERTFRPIGASSESISDFRLVAATNRNLDKMVKEGLFRLDLLHRLRSITIKLPALKKHPKDIDLLVSYYLQQHGVQSDGPIRGIAPEFLNNLKSYDWPGNIRELFNTLDYALANAGNNPTLYQINLPPNIRLSRFDGLNEPQDEGDSFDIQGLSLSQELPSLKVFRDAILEKAEKTYLIELMRKTSGRIKDACALADLSESRLHALLKKYDTPRFR